MVSHWRKPSTLKAVIAAAVAAVVVTYAGAAIAAPDPVVVVGAPTCVGSDIDAAGRFTLTCTLPAITSNPTPTSSPTPSPTPTAAPTTTSPTRTPTPTGGPAVLRPVDGGPGWYGQFTDPLPSSASFFPIGVWFESVQSTQDITLDKGAGLNTYVQLTANSNFALTRSNGMHIISSNETTTSNRNGWLLGDEEDMLSGPSGADVLTSVARSLPNDGRLRYTNVGKGVLFWQTDAQAARFLNLTDPHTGRPVLVSYDVYWFTDDDACQESQGGELLGLNRALTPAECQLAANYGRSIDRLRALDSGHDPVWGFVEVGRPGSTATRAITPAQIRAAVWSTIIHGARGVIYFNHSFSGPCQTQHALREPCYAAAREVVSATNGQIRTLAPVLNAPYVDGVLTRSGPADVAVKWHDGHFYVLAGANRAAAGTVTFDAPCIGNATVTVLDEGRTLPMVGGRFTDGFADGNSVHLYRVDGGGRCGLT